MNNKIVVNSVSLEALCQKQGQPFYRLSEGDFNKTRILKTLIDEQVLAFRMAEMYCGRLSDVVVFGKSYVADLKGSAVFLNQSHRNYFHQEFADYYQKEILEETRPRVHVEQECCFLGGYSGDVKFFGHFIFEFLYRLVAFDMCGLLANLPVFVHEGIPDAWLSFIELYGVPKERILKVPHTPASFYRNVWMAPCANLVLESKAYAFWDDGIHGMRKRLIANAVKDGAQGPKRVYLGRRNVAHRHVLNDSAVWEYLQNFGFEYPEFPGLSAAEQIQMIHSAEVIVAVGGSASVITHFAPANCIIMDVQPTFVAGGLGSLGFSVVIGQTYMRLPGIIPPENTKPDVNSDFSVDMRVLRHFVEKVCAK